MLWPVLTAVIGRKQITCLLAIIWLSASIGCGRRVSNRRPIAPLSIHHGIASWYGHPFHGQTTANGETYDMNEATAAHKTLPFETWVRVYSLDTGKQTRVRINDRGPFVEDRIIDLSRKAAAEIDMLQPGTARVRLEIIDPPALEQKKSGWFGVQVGSFRSRENADRLKRELSRRFSDVTIITAASFYRVTLGRLKTEESARELVERLLREPAVTEAYVVRLN